MNSELDCDSLIKRQIKLIYRPQGSEENTGHVSPRGGNGFSMSRSIYFEQICSAILIICPLKESEKNLLITAK